ncbi:MAG: hypothetical protein HYX41_02410 [Bdellovibrio sp.]|nr:hypothetical protein [Bdellovibrio sp.]
MARSTFGGFKPHRKLLLILLPAMAAGIYGCAAGLQGNSKSSATSTSPLTQQNDTASKLKGAHIDFHFSNFYSLGNPNPSTKCAGDANVYSDPIAMVLPSYPSDYVGYTSTTGSTGPLVLETSIIDPSTTIRPSFIKNVSVNLSNANAPVSANLAQTCAMGTGVGSPPVSNCSTFDFGSIGGLPTNMGGTLLLIGGLITQNYQGSTYTQPNGMTLSCGPAVNATSTTSAYGNTCTAQVMGIGINSLPSSAAGTNYAPGLTTASGPISSWANISSVAGYSGPVGAAGSVAAYDSSMQEILLFGGAAALSALTTLGPGPANYDTWIFNVENQQWSKVTTKANIDPAIQRLFDCAYPYSSGCAASLQLSKSPGGRAVFGYVAVQGMALNSLTTGIDSAIGNVTTYQNQVDTTDRIITVGGLGNCNGGYCTDSIRFNPTFGPEYRESDNGQNTLVSISSAVNPMQWIDPSPDIPISNSYNTIVSGANTATGITGSTVNSNLLATRFPTPNPTATPITSGTTSSGFGGSSSSGLPALPGPINFGAVALSNNSTSTTGVGPSGTYSVGTTVYPGAGYVLAAGGFYGFIAQAAGQLNQPDTNCTDITKCGGDLQISLRRGSL